MNIFIGKQEKILIHFKCLINLTVDFFFFSYANP